MDWVKVWEKEKVNDDSKHFIQNKENVEVDICWDGEKHEKWIWWIKLES